MMAEADALCRACCDDGDREQSANPISCNQSRGSSFVDPFL